MSQNLNDTHTKMLEIYSDILTLKSLRDFIHIGPGDGLFPREVCVNAI